MHQLDVPVLLKLRFSGTLQKCYIFKNVYLLNSASTGEEIRKCARVDSVRGGGRRKAGAVKSAFVSFYFSGGKAEL